MVRYILVASKIIACISFEQAEKRYSFKCGTFRASSLQKRRLATGDFGGRVNIWYLSLSLSLSPSPHTHTHTPTIHFNQTSMSYSRDLERLDSPTYSVKGHEGIINTIDGCGGLGIGGGAPEIVTGGRDGTTFSLLSH